MREAFDPNRSYEIAVVNNTPYLCCDLRIDRDSIPNGMHMYECADADSNGRVCRIQNGVMVNFFCTLIGKEELPMNDGIYSPAYDEEFDIERDKYENSLDEGLSDEELEEKMIAYDETHEYNDEFYYIGQSMKLDEYIREYDSLKEEAAKEEVQEEREV